jgi:hypothetical protein
MSVRATGQIQTENGSPMDKGDLLLKLLREKAKSLGRASLKDAVLTRQDLVDAIEPLRSHGLAVAVMFSQHRKLIPTMSFLYDEGAVSPVSDSATLRRKLNALREKGTTLSARSVYAEVFLVGSYEYAERAAKFVADIADIVFVQSLPARNVARDKRGQLIDRLRELIDSGSVTELAHLVIFLRHRYRHLHIPIDAVAYDGNAIDPISPAELINAPMERILTRIRCGKERKNKEEDCFANAFEGCVVESILTNKPFYFDPRDDGLTNVEIGSENASAKYLIMPVRSRTDPGLKSSAALVLISNKEPSPLSHELINSVNRCVDLFLTRKYRVGQTTTLALIERKVQEALLSPPLTGDSDLVGRLRTALKPILQAVVDSTAAHSAAVLEYRPDARRLVYFELHEHESAQTPHDGSKPENDAGISLRDWRTRLSAFAVLNAHLWRSVYVPNLNDTPRIYRKLELGTIFSKRKSGSEVSIPIRLGHFTFGVINFEARYRNAFDSDLQFLEAVADAIGNLITCHYQSSDAMWLLDNVTAEQALHELKNDIEQTKGNDAFLQDAKRQMSLIMEKGRPSNTPKSLVKTLQEVSSFLDSIMIETADKIQSKRYFEWYFDDDVTISARLADGISVILKNLVQNWREHARSAAAADDRLIVRVTPSDNRRTPLSLTIEVSFHAWYSEEILNSAFVAPIQGPERTSHGLYIVGVVTRALRGTLSFTRKPKQVKRKAGNKTSAVRLNIVLPILN